MTESILSLTALKEQLETYRKQHTRFFNRPTDEELALSNACEDRENKLLDFVIDALTPLLQREAEQQKADAFLEREGYRRCDIPACSCGSWHNHKRDSQLVAYRNDEAALLAENARVLTVSEDFERQLREQQAEVDALRQQLAEARQELGDLTRVMAQSTVGKAVQVLREQLSEMRQALKDYGQHKADCAKRTRETNDGLRVALEPWLAEKKPCTCGLSAVLSADQEPPR